MGFWGLVGLLSRLPGRNESPAEMARSVGLFPVVGLLLGALLGSLALVEWIVLPSLLFLLAFVASYLAVKGLLHLDGLADVADALAVHGTPEERQRVLKDPHLGAAGNIALGFFLISLVFLLASGPHASPLFPVPSSHVLGRPWPWGLFLAVLLSEVNAEASMVVTLGAGRPSPSSVMARPFSEASRGGVVLLVLATAGILSVLLGGWLVLSTLLALLAGVALARVAERTLGGVNGDFLGTAQALTFLGSLALAVLIPATLWPWPP